MISLKKYLFDHGVSCKFRNDGSAEEFGCTHTFFLVVKFGTEVVQEEEFFDVFVETARNSEYQFDCDGDFYANAPYDILISKDKELPFWSNN